MAEGVTVANAYVQIMPSAKDAKQNITDAILPAAESAGDSAGDAIGSGILSKIGALKGPLMAAGGALFAAIGVKEIVGGLLDIGGQFDDMVDAIVIGTGASGDALDALADSAKEIATTVPISFGDAGEIVADLSSRMGLVGDDLEEVGNRVAALGELTGKAINLDSLTGSLNAFGISADDAGAIMDYLWGVSQNTGIEFDKLTGILETNAPALTSFGFSMEEAANMAGLLDRAGLDASGTMGKMSKALVELAQPGESAEDAFRRVIDQMGAYIAAGDEAAALDLASQIFGTRGATQFLAAVESGSLALDDLQNAALGAGDGIMGTLEATMDWPERWELIKNSTSAALEPLGSAVMDAASAAMEHLSEAIAEIDPAVLEELGVMLGDTLMAAVDAFAGAIEFLVAHKEELGAFFGFWAEGIGDLIGHIGLIIVTVTDFVQIMATSFSELGTSLSKSWEDMKAKAQQTWENIKNTVTTTWSNIKSAVTGAVDGVRSYVSSAFEGIRSTASSIWNGIKDSIGNAINGARDLVSSAIESIKSLFNFQISWPHIPLPHFGISGSPNPLDWITQGVPQIYIDWYAKGGFVKEPTVISVAGESNKGGEFVWPSYEPYMSRYANALVDAMDKQGGNKGDVIVTGNQFYVRQESDIRAVALEINRLAQRERGARL